MNEIIVKDVVGENAISIQSGQKLYFKIHEKLKKGEVIVLDFDGVGIFASPFFNASIGLLLQDIELESLKALLSFNNLNEIGRDLLNHVIDNAIEYYQTKENVDAGIQSSNDNEEER